jgi:hypothetical protein
MTHFYAIFADSELIEMEHSLERSHDGKPVLVFGGVKLTPREKETDTDLNDIFLVKGSQGPLSDEKKRISEADRYEWTSGHMIDLFTFAREYMKRGGEIFLIMCLYDGITDEFYRPLDKMRIIDLDVDASIRILEPLKGWCALDYYTIYKFVGNCKGTRHSLSAPVSNIPERSMRKTDEIQSLWERTALRRRE